MGYSPHLKGLLQLLRTQEIHPIPPGRDRAQAFIFWPTGQGHDGEVWEDTPISPSSLGTALSCMRKYGWDKVDGIRSPPTPGQIRGTEHHGSLEGWLQRGEIPPAKHDRLLEALNFFPRPDRIGLSSERYFALWLDGVVFHGYTDADVIPPEGDLSTPEVYDLKTTRDMSWAKSTLELETDPQASIYALKTMVECGTAECWTIWVYCQMEGRKASIPVRKKWTLDEALKNVQSWLAHSRSMVEIVKKKPKVKDLQFNASHCGAYGGCHYVGHCALTNREKMFGQLQQEQVKRERKENMSGLKEKLAQARAEKGLTGDVPSGGQIAVQKAPEPKAEKQVEKAVVAATEKATVVAAEKVNGASNKLAEAVEKLSTAPVGAGSAINPPDASPDPRTADPKDIPVLEDKKTKAAAKKAAEKDAFKKAEAEVAALKAAQVSPAQPAPTATQAAPSRVEGQATAPVGPQPFTLLVGCFVTKGGQAFRIEDTILVPLRVELEASMSVPHYKLIDFNKGPAMLAAGVRNKMKETKPQGVWSVDKSTVDPEVLAALVEAADVVLSA